MVIEMTLLFLIYGSMAAYMGILLVGLPANLVLGLLRAERGIFYILSGAAGGIVPVAVLSGQGWNIVGAISLLAKPGGLTATLCG